MPSAVEITGRRLAQYLPPAVPCADRRLHPEGKTCAAGRLPAAGAATAGREGRVAPERQDHDCNRRRGERPGETVAHRDARNAHARLADDSDQSRPDRNDGDRRADDGPARFAGACRRFARFEPLFRAADFRARADAGRLADDRHRTRPQPPFGARRAPHRAPGLVDRHHGRSADLGAAMERRGDTCRDGPGAGPVGACGDLCAYAAMGGAAVLRLHRSALLHLGAGAARAGHWSSSSWL